MGAVLLLLPILFSLILLGLPVGFAEWAIGRHAGTKKAHTLPSFLWKIKHTPWLKYLGTLGVSVVLIISAFYLCLEAWTLFYTSQYLFGNMKLSSPQEYGAIFIQMSGSHLDGAAFEGKYWGITGFLFLAFVINFLILYKGIRKGIEFFCKWAMPALIIISLVMTVRVLTLYPPDASHPERTVSTGLAYMWEPSRAIIENKQTDGSWEKYNLVSLNDPVALAQATSAVEASNGNQRLTSITIWSQLRRPSVWLAAAGQMFFSLSVGYGTILCYASYLRKTDDIALSSLSAFTANEFCEVGIGGLMTVPAAVAFLGIAGAAGQSTFALAFNVLPQVFAHIPGGQIFGLLFFILLSLAAITSSISILQPSIAFLEEFSSFSKKYAILVIFFIVITGSVIISWFSKDLTALDTINFFAGTLLPFLLAFFVVVIFAWIWGINKGFQELNQGAAIKIPHFFKYITKYITPIILVVIFLSFIYENIFQSTTPCLIAIGQGNTGAVLTIGWMILVITIFALIAYYSHQFKEKR